MDKTSDFNFIYTLERLFYITHLIITRNYLPIYIYI